jgi:hypothetical protein
MITKSKCFLNTKKADGECLIEIYLKINKKNTQIREVF